MYQLTFPIEKKDIKRISSELRAEIKTREGEISLLRKMLNLVCSECSHPGATYYSDPRDGGGMNPCPVCGHSE